MSDTSTTTVKNLDVMDKAIIKQHYREKFLSDFIWYERGKYTIQEYRDIIKRNIDELCDEIQGYDTPITTTKPRVELYCPFCGYLVVIQEKEIQHNHVGNSWDVTAKCWHCKKYLPSIFIYNSSQPSKIKEEN